MKNALLNLRKFIPPNGARYEQFNVSMLFGVIIFCNYVLASPQPTTQDALGWLLGDISLMFWRIFLGVCATIAVLGSLFEITSKYALSVLAFAGVTWCAVLFVGFIGDPKPQIFGSAVLYGAFARQAFYIARFGGSIKGATRKDNNVRAD